MNDTFNRFHYGHDFIKYTCFGFLNDYQCTKCKMVIEYYYFKNQYFIITVHGPNSYSNNETVNISCDEFIIKNIIE